MKGREREEEERRESERERDRERDIRERCTRGSLKRSRNCPRDLERELFSIEARRSHRMCPLSPARVPPSRSSVRVVPRVIFCFRGFFRPRPNAVSRPASQTMMGRFPLSRRRLEFPATAASSTRWHPMRPNYVLRLRSSR